MAGLWQVTGTGTGTSFLYDGDELVVEYDAAGTLARRYDYGCTRVMKSIAGAAMQLIGKFCLLLLLSASAQSRPFKQWVTVDSNCNVQQFYGLRTDLTIDGLKRLPYVVKLGSEFREGDEYTTAAITAEKGVQVKVTFGDDGKLDAAETTSGNAIGPRGVGVGSSLSAVRAAWPAGKLLYGAEEGRAFVTYVTGTNVLLEFNPKDMPSELLVDHRMDIVIPNIRVSGIRISSIPVSVPANCVPGYCS